MANTLRFKRGLASGIPTGVAGEPLFTTDTFDLYIGNGTTNTRFQKYIASGTTSQLLRGDGSLLTMPIVLTSPANGQVLKYNGTSWVNDSDAGITGSGAAGQVAYFTGATTQAGSNNLFWDAANVRLGIGTNIPISNFSIYNTTESVALIANGVVPDGTKTGGTVRLYLGGTGAVTGNYAFTNDVLGKLSFHGYGNTFFYEGANIQAVVTNGGNIIRELHTTALDFYTKRSGPNVPEFRMRLTDLGRLLLNSTTDSGQRLQVTGTAYFSDSVGIGSTGLTGINLRISKNITGSVTGYGVLVDSQINSDATSAVNIFNSVPSTQAATFNIGSLIHFIANQGTQGASSTISNQYGFLAQAGLTGASNNYGFFGNIPSGTNRWNIYMGGTANNYMAGSLGIGTNNPNFPLHVIGNVMVSKNSNYLFDQLDNADNGAIVWRNADGSRTTSAQITSISDGTFARKAIGFFTKDVADWTTAATEKMRLTALGNLHIGTFSSDSGEKLQVNGTAKITGATTLNSTLTLSSTASSFIVLDNTTPTNGKQWRLSSAVDGKFYLTHVSVIDAVTILPTSGNVGIGAINPAEKLVVSGNAIVTGNLTVDTNTLFVDATNNRVGVNMTPSYALDVTGSARVSDAIAIGTTPDSTNPFKILKNINATVGIKFENTNTSSLAFSAVQLGNDITGGTAFTNLVYGSSGITESGVYKPSGTALINTGSGGLNFLAVSQPIRFFTSTGNGTLRAAITNDGDFTQYNGTNPSASTTDAFRMYSADVTAGNAAPHFRTENGAVIKLYQETTSVGNSIFSAGGGNSVLDDSTFDGYTLRQIVKALRNQGILA